ncbi:DUF262 domain-containing protein [Kitasatospora sp. NPDC088351]|uniref:GmrSD restriction endonuclease domain-containing protein n=1 Tax=Kitasatospora sp. NPDC088351 TaxID=3155180 RepID=UPI00341E9038
MSRVAKLADRVLSGDIVLPKFQRGFVWTPQQILYLLDSVARNYPIGSVLLWQTAEEMASERTVAGLTVDAPRHGYPVNYIIDGQQRLASIFGALHWQPGRDPESKWNIAYDLEQQKFLHLKSFDPAPMNLMPMWLIADPSSFFGRVADIEEPELRDRAKQLFSRFSDYQVPVVTLREMSSGEVAKVFERINSTGTDLTIVDLVRAATWSPEFDLKDEIETLLSVLDEKRYGRIDTKTMLRTISAASGFGFSRTDIDRLRELPKEELRGAVEVAAQASRRAVDFLSTQIRAPRAEALPYYNQFAVLADVFRQLPKPSTVQYEALHRWFWLTASGEYFKGWNESQMAADRQAVTAFAEGRATEIEAGAGMPRSVLWRRSAFRRTNAPSKLLALLLAYAAPLDLRTGQRIDVDKALSWQNDKEFHHFFPKAFLKGQGVGAAQANVCGNLVMLSSVSNIWVSDKPPSQYLKDICATDGEKAVRERLASCLVDEDAFQAAMRDDYEAFLRARSETLHERLMALIGSPEGALAGDLAPLLEEGGEESDFDPDEPVDRDSAD